MSGKRNKLDRLVISKPCSNDWDSMTGGREKRHCSDCDRTVYDVSKLTLLEAEALVFSTRGRLCLRLTKDANGSVVTSQWPGGLPPAPRRVSPLGGAVVGAILGISGSAAGYSPSSQLVQIESVRDAASNPQPGSNAADSTGTLQGTILDPNGAVMQGATVTLRNPSSGEARLMTTSDDGLFKFEAVRPGSYEVEVQAVGFSTHVMPGVNVGPSPLVQQSTPLELAMSVAPLAEAITIRLDVAPITAVAGGAMSAPSPLRVLYNESELIVVGRVGRSKKMSREGDATVIRTRVEISTLLKGEAIGSTINVYHSVYDLEKSQFVAGDELLLFLDRRQDSETNRPTDGYEVSDLRNGLRKLPPSELAVYESRIRELSEIMKEPTRDSITAWLVRCAENPATRWEGAVELGRSARSVRDRLEEASKNESSQEMGEATIPSSSEQAVEPNEEEDSDTLFVLSLTEEQKERLANALYSTAVVGDTEMELIDLQKELGDKRLLPFLVDQLHAAEIDPTYVAERMIEIVDELMDDDDVTEVAEAYQDKVSYEDLEEDEEDSERTAEEKRERAEAAEEAKTNRKALLRAFLTVVNEKMKQPATAKDEPENPHSTH